MAWDWQADLIANSPKRGVSGAIKAFLLDPSFTFVVWVRLFLYSKSRNYLFSGLITSLIFSHIIKTFSCEVNYETIHIGKGLKVPHPIGIVIGANASLGNNVTLFHNVTIGRRNLGSECQIYIGNNVLLSAGVVVLGPVKVGDNAIIGANSVVLNDVEEDVSVGGIPAKVLSKRIV